MAIIGDVDILIQGDTSGVQSAVSDLGKSLSRSFAGTFDNLGASLTSSLAAAGKKVVSVAGDIGRGAAKAIGDSLDLGVKVAGASAAAILGTSLTKGMARMKAIDNAEASLRGFAKTADHIPEIMDAATNAVTGTAFGLEQAASSAAQFAAANVPVQDMEKHLTSLANSAAGAGGDFDRMSDVFAKVAARGKVTGQTIDSLVSMNVDGLSALADHFGITSEAAQKMVSRGEVSFEDFSAAMDKAMGTAAIEQAKTFSGLMANVGASMGRFGQVMQQPFFDATKAVLPGVMNLFNQFKGVLEPIAQIIADRLIPFAEKLGDALSGLSFKKPSVEADSLFGTLGALAPVLGAIAATFAGPLLSSLPVVGSLFSGLTGPVGLLLGALIPLFAMKPDTLIAGMESIGEKLPRILTVVVNKVAEVVPELADKFVQNAPILVEGFTSMFGEIVNAVGKMIPTIAKAITKTLPVLVKTLTGMIKSAVDAIAGVLPSLIPEVVAIIGVLVTSLLQALPDLLETGITLLLSVLEGIVAAIPMMIETIGEVIGVFIQSIAEMLPMILDAGIQILLAVIDGIILSIPALIEALVNLLPVMLEAIIGMLPSIIDGALTLFLGIMEAMVKATPDIIAALMDLLPELIDSLLSMLPTLIEGAFQLFLGIMMGLIEAIPDILSAVIDMIPQIVETLISMTPELVAATIQLMGGIIKGIFESIPQILSALGEAGMRMVDKVLGFVGDFFNAAGEIIQGMIDGFWAGVGALGEAIVNVVDDAIGGLLGWLGIASPSKMFKGFGINMGEGLIVGMDSMQNAIGDSLMNMIPDDDLQKAMTVDTQIMGIPDDLLGNSSGSLRVLNAIPERGVDSVGDAMVAGRSVIIEAGAIVVNGATDPRATALEVVDAIAEEIGS